MDKVTIDTYNQLATEYDEETITFWEKFPATVFDKFINSIDGKKVLDVGSGPGRDGLILKKRGMDVTCLDASKSMVDICLERGLKAMLGDFNSMPFDSLSFDAVWAYTSLIHIPKSDIDTPLQEIDRVLKPGGVFGLGMIEGETEGYRESFGVRKPRWFSYYTKDELEKILKRHGFKVNYFEEFTPGSKTYLNFICSKTNEN